MITSLATGHLQQPAFVPAPQYNSHTPTDVIRRNPEVLGSNISPQTGYYDSTFVVFRSPYRQLSEPARLSSCYLDELRAAEG